MLVRGMSLLRTSTASRYPRFVVVLLVGCAAQSQHPLLGVVTRVTAGMSRPQRWCPQSCPRCPWPLACPGQRCVIPHVPLQWGNWFRAPCCLFMGAATWLSCVDGCLARWLCDGSWCGTVCVCVCSCRRPSTLPRYCTTCAQQSSSDNKARKMYKAIEDNAFLMSLTASMQQSRRRKVALNQCLQCLVAATTATQTH